MNSTLSHRQATLNDLLYIVSLLKDDELGQMREQASMKLDQRYIDAFNKIASDSNAYLMVVLFESEIVGTCQLNLLPSLTFMGATRLQIEAVRVASGHRKKGIGEWMIRAAIAYGKTLGASIFQLSTNKKRDDAKKFYQRLGFEATHEGMKLYE